MTAATPEVENGAVLLGPFVDEAQAIVRHCWPFARTSPLGDAATRIDLSAAPGGACPGVEDSGGLAMLSVVAPVFGWFCDARAGVEGVRVFDGGHERDRRLVEWSRGQPADPIAWPIGSLALTLQLPVDAITRVARPGRPPLSLAIEALLNGAAPPEAPLLHQALEALGSLELDRATEVLVTHLRVDDWVARFHAARAYTRLHRRPGQDGRPRLEALLADDDEGVREAALAGLLELLPRVEFSDLDLHGQIDAAVARGLADEDEDVRATAARVQALRRELLG